MVIQGKNLIQLIHSRRQDRDDLGLIVSNALDHLAGTVSEAESYDLFAIFEYLILRTGKSLGPIIADLLSAVSLEDAATLDDYTISEVGHYFRDIMKHQEILLPPTKPT